MAIYGQTDVSFTGVGELDTATKMKNAYGCMYNYYAVSDSRGVMPLGFNVAHVAD